MFSRIEPIIKCNQRLFVAVSCLMHRSIMARCLKVMLNGGIRPVPVTGQLTRYDRFAAITAVGEMAR